MKKLVLFILSVFTFGFFAFPVRAASPLGCNGNPNALDTAIGCIPIFDLNGPNGFMAFVIAWGVGIAGGIAFLLILFAGFQIMTSSGNPQKLQAGKELLGAAVSGLLLLIFSAFVLRVVGVDILQIF
jgi:hypothetical protein